MDATPHEWVPDSIWHLHLAIDDASGRIVGAWFDTQETLNAYYHVFYQILSDHGIPYKFLLTAVRYSPTKRKIPHLSMRIHIHSSLMPVTSWC
jgi:hypothetical protein